MKTIASRCNCDDPKALQGLFGESRPGAPRRRLVPFVRALTAALLGIAGMGSAQSLPDLYRITKGVSQYHVEYHQVSLSKGAELVLADLAGPGKVTYLYITDDTQVRWYPGLVLKVYGMVRLIPASKRRCLISSGRLEQDD